MPSRLLPKVQFARKTHLYSADSTICVSGEHTELRQLRCGVLDTRVRTISCGQVRLAAFSTFSSFVWL